MGAENIIQKTLTLVILMVFIGAVVPILILSWSNLTAAFSGTVLASIFGSVIGVLIIGGAVAFMIFKKIKL